MKNVLAITAVAALAGTASAATVSQGAQSTGFGAGTEPNLVIAYAPGGTLPTSADIVFDISGVSGPFTAYTLELDITGPAVDGRNRPFDIDLVASGSGVSDFVFSTVVDSNNWVLNDFDNSGFGPYFDIYTYTEAAAFDATAYDTLTLTLTNTDPGTFFFGRLNPGPSQGWEYASVSFIPAPGAAGLLAVAGLAAGRRRRA